MNKTEIDKVNETNSDKSITFIAAPENIVGIEGFKAYFQNYLIEFSDITCTLINVFGQDDKIFQHWNFKGTHTGEFFGILASMKKAAIDGVTRVKTKDGKIRQEQDFLDNLSFFLATWNNSI
ncbi:ester cyclase [Maribacter sp. ACAM166]|uniref:ester cyclase n=1 Tax=Maribacter sp. ACAM166 TaxID=2508996 RepID=UPI0010FE9969|nr:ester cyclase [Maribacter sp. ACAM166]TLP82812.1 ester cyclase [Maribacter sp. ACAM166]